MSQIEVKGHLDELNNIGMGTRGAQDQTNEVTSNAEVTEPNNQPFWSQGS